MTGMLDKAVSAGKAIGSGAIRTGVQFGAEVAKPYVQGAMYSALDKSVEILKGQPKPKKLLRRIADMKERRGWIEEDARHLASEITELKRTFDSLSAGSLVKKKRLKSEMRKRLVLQHGLPDYISLLLSGAEGKSMSTDEVRFFKSYSKYLDGKKLDNLDREHIDDYVKEHHGFDIQFLRPRNTDSALARLWAYDVN